MFPKRPLKISNVLRGAFTRNLSEARYAPAAVSPLSQEKHYKLQAVPTSLRCCLLAAKYTYVTKPRCLGLLTGIHSSIGNVVGGSVAY